MWFYSLHVGVFFSFFCLPLQFGALLNLHWDPNLKLGKAAHRQTKMQLLEEDKKQSLPAPGCVCSEQSKVDHMEIAMHIKHASCPHLTALVSNARSRDWKPSLSIASLARTVSVFQTHHICSCIYFLFSNSQQSTPVPTLGLMDSNRYMRSSTALCLASVRRVLKLLTSYVRWLKSYSSRQLAGNLECSWPSTFQSRPSFPLILSLSMQTQRSPFLHTTWTAHTDNQTHCWNLGNLHSRWLSSCAPFLLIYK